MGEIVIGASWGKCYFMLVIILMRQGSNVYIFVMMSVFCMMSGLYMCIYNIYLVLYLILCMRIMFNIISPLQTSDGHDIAPAIFENGTWRYVIRYFDEGSKVLKL